MDVAADPALASKFLATLREILEEERGEPVADINFDSKIDSVFEDSLEFYSTVMALEDVLDIHLDLGRLENIGQTSLAELFSIQD
jgi:acyl carrier protein